jgi:hypothetical protein
MSDRTHGRQASEPKNSYDRVDPSFRPAPRGHVGQPGPRAENREPGQEEPREKLPSAFRAVLCPVSRDSKYAWPQSRSNPLSARATRVERLEAKTGNSPPDVTGRIDLC